jgi:hypothetical protein
MSSAAGGAVAACSLAWRGQYSFIWLLAFEDGVLL